MCPAAATDPTPSAAQSAALTRFLDGKPYQTKWTRYFSKVRIQATAGGAGAGYAPTNGVEVKAFAYGNGADMGIAGIPGQLATYADTNIITPNTTIAGEALEVHGIGLILLGTSDANFTKASDGFVSAKLRLNGGSDYPLGLPTMIPGPGGFMGSSESLSTIPDQTSQVGITIGALSNGLPHATNYQYFDEPFVWASAGHADSALNVIMKVERSYTTSTNYSAVTRAAVAPGAGTVGTAVYTSPPATAIFTEWMVVLIGRTVLPLSSN